MFSVIMPVYNKLPHLERSINSVLNQTIKDFELIIIDDASTDGSTDKIKSFSDPRIRYFEREEPGPGGYAARNLGIKNAKYEWINFLDADDEWDLQMLEQILNVIKSTNAEIISTGLAFIDGDIKIIDRIKSHDKRKIFEFTLTDYLNEYQFISTDTITLRRNIIMEAGMFPGGDKCKRGGDMDTWIRCLQKSKLNIRINETLAFYYTDTINRVTDIKRNIPQLNCPYDTVMKVYKETSDPNLKKAIEGFCDRLIYGVLASRVQLGHPIDYKLVSLMHFNPFSVSRITKLHLNKLAKTFAGNFLF